MTNWTRRASSRADARDESRLISQGELRQEDLFSAAVASPDYLRSVTCCAYHVACEQVVFHPLKGTMSWQVDDHAIRKLMDVPPLLQTPGQKYGANE